MAREVRIINWCDPCFREGNRIEADGDPIVITVGTRKSDKPRELMLCEVHMKEVLSPLLAELEHAPIYKDDALPTSTPTSVGSSGVKRGGWTQTPKEEDPTPCTICSEVFGTEFISKNPDSCHTHRLQRHKIGNAEYKAWRRGEAEVAVDDATKMTVKVKVHPLPAPTAKWDIPEDFICSIPDCTSGEGGGRFTVDPRQYGTDIEAQQTAYRVLGAHKASAHRE
jgi:hypothetical protein